MNKTNTNLTVLDVAVCRTPAFSLSDDFTENWPALKELIREASPAFFEVIKNLHLHELDEKTYYTAWKYFNRARFRSTPFGSFAAISSVPVQAGGLPIVLRSNMIKRHFINWSEKDELHKPALPNLFMANTTWYQVAGEIRYLCYLNGQFELTSIADFPELQAILTAGSQPVTALEIVKMLAKRFKLAAASARALLHQLAEAQLLLTDHTPNITGPDYFTRLNHKELTDNATGYIIAERTVANGAIDKTKLQGIPAYLQFMNGFLAVSESQDLNNFKIAFQKKFDLKAIPLSVAMDPHTGIGYGDMARSPEGEMPNTLLESLQQKRHKDRQVTYNAQYRFLLNALMTGEPIQLEKYTEPAPAGLPSLPNTLSVMYHRYQNQVVIGRAGGCTANALLGRFTLDSARLTQAGKEIAAHEENANPGILFFDVAYQAEKQVDNVNRRSSLYQAELPLLSWSCHPSPLNVADILVAVRDNQIILWSKKHQRRVVPRIASAYNYTRSDLALFRFLCDLQHQRLRADLSFSLQHLFPGLAHYPRVCYRNFIVSPASWLVNKTQIGDLPSLRKWLSLKQINCPFHCGSSDQTLLVNPAKEDDLKAFIRYVAQNKEIYVTEALLDDDSVTDENGKAYVAEYIAALGHDQQLYPAYPHLDEADSDHIFLPGSEWLYVEIHGHVTQANQLLAAVIQPFLACNKKLIKHWFFIRYAVGGPHIRLRLRLHDQAHGMFLLNELNSLLTPLFRQRRLWDLQVRTYVRETERYGAERIELVEDFFARDSLYVLRLLNAVDNTEQLYHQSLQLMEELCRIVFPDPAVRLSFIQTVADSFAREFNFEGDDFKRINRAFENLERVAAPLTPGKTYLKAFGLVMDSCTDALKKRFLLADLFHMHINRVYHADQRMHEAVLYQYLLKLAKKTRYANTTNAAVLLPTH